MTPRPEQLLPWSNAELEIVLRDLIAHGTETPKADCKAEIETGTTDGKADLLKDITAIANTYGVEYGDYGFLIYGVARKTIIGVATTQADTDKLQSHVEQLLRSYVAPMPQVFVIGFTADEDKKWGVIVIPPRNAKPYMFVKEIQCADPRRSRKRGEWFVRRGSTAQKTGSAIEATRRTRHFHAVASIFRARPTSSDNASLRGSF
jgi:predicted HTH transcriptional regulator